MPYKNEYDLDIKTNGKNTKSYNMPYWIHAYILCLARMQMFMKIVSKWFRISCDFESIYISSYFIDVHFALILKIMVFMWFEFYFQNYQTSWLYSLISLYWKWDTLSEENLFKHKILNTIYFNWTCANHIVSITYCVIFKTYNIHILQF